MAPTAEKIRLKKEKEYEPYLATLYGKALDADVEGSILGDRLAAEAVSRIDYDFKSLKMQGGGEVSLPLRARHFDEQVRAFLAEHPEATVLHLGCGLDTRVFRIDPGPKVRWFDVDFPDIIDLRDKLYPEREGYKKISSSVTDLSWLDQVPGDLPVFVVAEGLMMYLHEEDGAALLRRITEKFPSGQIAFDAYSRAMVRLVTGLIKIRGAKVKLVWGIRDPRDIERQVPKLRLVEEVSFLTMPELVRRMTKGPFSAGMGALLGRIPLYQKLIRHVRYEFP